MLMAAEKKPDAATPPESPSAASSDRPQIVRSEDLLQGKRELWIEHRGEIYRLRLTSSGKLYLTK